MAKKLDKLAVPKKDWPYTGPTMREKLPNLIILILILAGGVFVGVLLGIKMLKEKFHYDLFELPLVLLAVIVLLALIVCMVIAIVRLIKQDYYDDGPIFFSGP